MLLTGGDGKTYVSDKSSVCKVDTDCYSPSEECTGVDKSRDESTGICTCKIWSCNARAARVACSTAASCFWWAGS